MTTVTLWLLVSIGVGYHDSQRTAVVERFASEQECARVRDAIVKRSEWHAKPPLQCIQAAVVKP